MFLRTFIYFTKLLFLDLCVWGGGADIASINCTQFIVRLSPFPQKCKNVPSLHATAIPLSIVLVDA